MLKSHEWDDAKLPRAVEVQNAVTKQPMELVSFRLNPDQIDVIDGLAYGLKISRSEFIRNFIIQSLDLPVNGKRKNDGFFGEWK